MRIFCVGSALTDLQTSLESGEKVIRWQIGNSDWCCRILGSTLGWKKCLVSPIPIWCGGSTPAACRRVVAFGDGWLPARITLATFTKRMAYLREVSKEAGHPLMTAGVMPLTSIAEDRETALGHVNVKSLISEANKNSTWVKPAGGIFSTLDDIRGLVLAGTPEDIIRGTRA